MANEKSTETGVSILLSLVQCYRYCPLCGVFNDSLHDEACQFEWMIQMTERLLKEGNAPDQS